MLLWNLSLDVEKKGCDDRFYTLYYLGNEKWRVFWSEWSCEVISIYIYTHTHFVHILRVQIWKIRCNMFIFRYTMDMPRFSDHLEAIKFICKDFWSELFKKQIDNLKTNHKVISSNEELTWETNARSFAWIYRIPNFACVFRVHLYCKIVSFVGFPAYRSILLRMEMYLKIIPRLRPKTRWRKWWACICISPVES